jgi:REP element-mobilizing transposase RayT
VQYPGALYHVINRGNYQSDIFEDAGAAKAFAGTLAQACERHGWRIHAYTLMRNHYHLALETPEPNLALGMQWLQATFAARFNRFRSKHGHLFQGRYKALLIEDSVWLSRVVNYIHLNPVRAHIVLPETVASYKWSSLHRWLSGARASWLTAGPWLVQMGLTDCPSGWRHYIDYLASLARDPAEQKRQSFDELEHGWAIGTAGWRRALARELTRLTLPVGLAAPEARAIHECRWRDELDRGLREAGKSAADIASDQKGARWKVELAARLRRTVAAPYRWITAALNMGSPLAVRVNVCRQTNR